MILVWINTFIVWLKSLIIPPTFVRKIDPNAPCPSCGNTQGKLGVAQRPSTKAGEANVLVWWVQHDCAVCKAIWWEEPVIASSDVQR